jgi:putative SOS response-associated peptidase YedK
VRTLHTIPLLVGNQRLYRLTTDWEKQRNDAPADNVAPTHPVSSVTAGENDSHRLREGRWSLVPWWAKEMPKGAMTHARIETADTPAPLNAFASTRCLIPADGFYEWTKSPDDGGKCPWHIFQPGHHAFAFAGLWASNNKLEVTSCTIITMPAADPIRQLHDRQSVACTSRVGTILPLRSWSKHGSTAPVPGCVV